MKLPRSELIASAASADKDWADIGRESAIPIDTVPEDYKTTKQLAQIWGVATVTASHKLTLLCDAGKVELKRFYVKTGQVVRPVPHYKIIRK